MTQAEQLDFLIRELMPDINIPANTAAKWRLFRSLVNMRPAGSVSEKFLITGIFISVGSTELYAKVNRSIFNIVSIFFKVYQRFPYLAAASLSICSSAMDKMQTVQVHANTRGVS